MSAIKSWACCASASLVPGAGGTVRVSEPTAIVDDAIVVGDEGLERLPRSHVAQVRVHEHHRVAARCRSRARSREHYCGCSASFSSSLPPRASSFDGTPAGMPEHCACQRALGESSAISALPTTMVRIDGGTAGHAPTASVALQAGRGARGRQRGAKRAPVHDGLLVHHRSVLGFAEALGRNSCPVPREALAAAGKDSLHLEMWRSKAVGDWDEAQS